MEDSFPCSVTVLKGAEAEAALAEAQAVLAPAVEFVRAPAKAGAQLQFARAPASQGNTR